MSYEITNSLRSSSVIRFVEPGTYTVQLANLSSNVSTETVNSASIKRLIWSTNGSISVTRNSQKIVDLYDSGEMILTEIGHTVANNQTSAIVVTITTGGTLFMEVTKDTTYTPAL